MPQASRIISYVFHPLWMPLISFLLAINTDPYFLSFFPKELFNLFLIILAINIIAPGLSLIFMWKRGLIGDLEISKRSERLVPFFIVLVYYLLSYLMLKQRDLPVPPAVYSMFLGVILTLLTSILVNAVWKISIHMMAAGGLTGAFLGLFSVHNYSHPPVLMACIGISAAVAFARIYSGRHIPSQVYAGFLTGVLINYMALSQSWIF